MNQFNIKDIEHLSGIKAHTIRIWEQRYSFLQPHRTNTNIRYYNNEQLKMILNISLLNKYGFKISHIDKMSADDIRQKILTLSNTQAKDEAIVNDLIQYMVDLDMYNYEMLLQKSITERGMEKAVMQIVFPFLEKIGLLWQTNHIHPAQEHLVSNIIRQKLIAALDKNQPVNPSDAPKTLLMFLPEGELHEIGLLFIYYVLRSKGYNIMYVGSDVPMTDLVAIASIKKIDCLYTHLTSLLKKFPVEKFINTLTEKIPSTPIIISGNLVSNHSKSLPNTCHLSHSLSQSLELVEQFV